MHKFEDLNIEYRKSQVNLKVAVRDYIFISTKRNLKSFLI